MQDGYARRSREFLAQATEELNKGDLAQASEKLWGAAAQIVKSVAARRRWRHDSHRALGEAVVRLAWETGDDSLRTLFQIATGLHFNFYEGVHPRELVVDGIKLTNEFVEKVERL